MERHSLDTQVQSRQHRGLRRRDFLRLLAAGSSTAAHCGAGRSLRRQRRHTDPRPLRDRPKCRTLRAAASTAASAAPSAAPSAAAASRAPECRAIGRDRWRCRHPGRTPRRRRVPRPPRRARARAGQPRAAQDNPFGTAGKKGGIYTVVVAVSGGYPQLFRGETYYGSLVFWCCKLLYTPLVILDRNWNKMRPGLATSWDWSSDQKQLTLKLRKGVKFHDGQEMTAKDVEFTYKLMVRKEPPRPSRTSRSSRRGQEYKDKQDRDLRRRRRWSTITPCASTSPRRRASSSSTCPIPASCPMHGFPADVLTNGERHRPSSNSSGGSRSGRGLQGQELSTSRPMSPSKPSRLLEGRAKPRRHHLPPRRSQPGDDQRHRRPVSSTRRLRRGTGRRGDTQGSAKPQAEQRTTSLANETGLDRRRREDRT